MSTRDCGFQIEHSHVIKEVYIMKGVPCCHGQGVQISQSKE